MSGTVKLMETLDKGRQDAVKLALAIEWIEQQDEDSIGYVTVDGDFMNCLKAEILDKLRGSD